MVKSWRKKFGEMKKDFMDVWSFARKDAGKIDLEQFDAIENDLNQIGFDVEIFIDDPTNEEKDPMLVVKKRKNEIPNLLNIMMKGSRKGWLVYIKDKFVVFKKKRGPERGYY